MCLGILAPRRLPLGERLELALMQDVLPGRRIAHADELAFRAQIQPQHAAADHRHAVHAPRRQTRVPAVRQRQPLQTRLPSRKHVPLRIEQPVLRHAHRRVGATLEVQVLRRRRRRRDLQHPVRRLALLPHQVARAAVRPHAERHQHVRRDAVPRVAFLRVHQHVRHRQRIRMRHFEIAGGLHDGLRLPRVVGHRPTVGAGVEHVPRGGARADVQGRGGSRRWHGAVLLYGHGVHGGRARSRASGGKSSIVSRLLPILLPRALVRAGSGAGSERVWRLGKTRL